MIFPHRLDLGPLFVIAFSNPFRKLSSLNGDLVDGYCGYYVGFSSPEDMQPVYDILSLSELVLGKSNSIIV
jgi:hypothetical protein